MEAGSMILRLKRNFWLFFAPLLFANLLNGESEPVDSELATNAPYVFSGRLFASSFKGGSARSGSGVAVGPGVVLTAAHVYWTDSWENGALPEGASPWLGYQNWYPGASSSSSESFDNVTSVVSLAGYDDVLHEYDETLGDSTSPFEAFNRDSLILIFSDDTATPHWVIRSHPQASESGFMGQKNFYEVVGYPTGKYSGSDSRKWLVHRTTERDPLVVSKVPSFVYDAGYSFENRLYIGDDPLDSYAGNSGGPVIARARDTERWLLVGVYVGSNALFRAMDQELASMIDTAIDGQNEGKSGRFRFTTEAVTITEGDEVFMLGVERLGDATEPANAFLSEVNTTPGLGSDFNLNYILNWDAGESGIKEIAIDTVDDDLREGSESYVLLLDGQLHTYATPHTVVVTIEDNDLNEPLDLWTAVDEVGAVNYSEIVFAEGKFVSAGLTNVVRWSPGFEDVVVTEFPELNRLFQLTYAKGMFVASGDGPQIIVSEDAESWEIVELPNSVSILSIQYGNGLFVGVGGIDAGVSSQGEIWVSEDARTWTKTYDERHDRFDDIEFGNGFFLTRAGSDIYRSDDGLNWQMMVTQGLSGIPSDMEFGAGRFVNAGRLGGIYYTVDGVDWTRVRQEDDEAWFGVGYRNGHFLATGISGKLATSTDGGLTWVDRFPGTTESIWHGVTAVGKMVIIGDNGLLMEASLPDYFDFIYEPVSQTVDLGETVSFFADFLSSKTGPYTFQWQKDGADLLGETSATLIISDAAPGNDGDYQLIVSGDGTTYSSAVAILDVEFIINPVENASASTTTSRGVMLSWDDVSSGETGYAIEHRIVGSGVWEFVANLDENSTSYSDRGLQPDTDYEYRLSTIYDGALNAQVITTVKTLPATNFVNLSTRGLVGKNDNVMIGGFTIPQGPDMTLYIRGLGPSLQSSGISNTISDPQLRLVHAPTTNPIEIINTDWMDSANLDAILSAGLPPTDELESAILTTLPPGGYTIILSSQVDEPPSVGMIEIYDITEDCENCRIINLSTRALVSVGNDLMIGGLVISGIAEKQIFVRALGPSLFGLANTLQDPFLKMVTGEGAEASIDNWSDSLNADIIANLGLPLADNREVGELYQFVDGTYTFQVSGVAETTGVALLEIFEVE
jgi:hypothetical protein